MQSILQETQWQQAPLFAMPGDVPLVLVSRVGIQPVVYRRGWVGKPSEMMIDYHPCSSQCDDEIDEHFPFPK